MNKKLETPMLGYGEDGLTLWVLKNRISEVQNKFQDTTNPLIIFYRPCFKGSGKWNFGEFDSIFASSKYIYLIESKTDINSKGVLAIDSGQIRRHDIFSWYLQSWDIKYKNKWEIFITNWTANFHTQFPIKKMAPTNSLSAINIEFILTELQRYYGGVIKKDNIKDVLLFFHNGDETKSPPFVQKTQFKLIDIDYSHEIIGSNFFNLD